MKRRNWIAGFVAVLVVSAMRAQTPINLNTQVSSGTTTVSGLPLSPFMGQLWLVTDGAGPTPCAAGGGSAHVLCRWNGAAWDAFGGTTGGGPLLQTDGTNNASQTNLNIQDGAGTTATNPSGGNVQVNVTYGNAANTAAQGNDSRITGAEQTANKGAASGYAPLDATSLVPVANVPNLPESMIINLVSDLAGKQANLGFTPENSANKGAFNGYAPLDATGKVPGVNLPSFSSTWGGITGTLSNQTDLQTALNGKQANLGFTPENSANKGAANGYAPLNASKAVPAANIPNLPESKITNLVSDLAGKQPNLGFTPENSVNKGANNGYAPLDATGKVPTINLPSFGATWGGIIGTLTNQTDLQTALNGKQPNLGFTPENSANKGAAGGYAPLDATSLVPVANVPNLPESMIINLVSDLAGKQPNLGFTPENSANKGANNGYAPLDATGKVPTINLPSFGATWGGITGTLSNQTDLQTALNGKQATLGFTPENSANKGTAGGYAPLDATSLVPVGNIPNLAESKITNLVSDLASKQATSAKDTANGYAGLDGTGKLSAAELPLTVTIQGNSFNGNGQLVQLTAAGQYPALDGSLITNLPSGVAFQGTPTAGQIATAYDATHIQTTGVAIDPSNNISTAGSMSTGVSGSVAGYSLCGQGTDPTSAIFAANPHSFAIYCPTSITTPYAWLMATAGPNSAGILHLSAGVMTNSILVSALSSSPITKGDVDGSIANATTGAIGTLTDGATVTWAMASAYEAMAKLTFTTHGGSRTLNVSGLVSGGKYDLYLVQDATGGETLTGGTGCAWLQAGGGGAAFNLTGSAAATDKIHIDYDGTHCYATLTKAFS